MAARRPGSTGTIGKVLKMVLDEVRPSSGEIALAGAVSNEIMDRLRKSAPRGVDVILAGSVARGTQTSGNSDIDIFMLFPKTDDERKMEKKGLEVAKRIVDSKRGERYIIKYAEHPYLQLIMKNPPVKADLVPAFKIADSYEMGSAVDRTQLHNEFIMEHLDAAHKDQVRILKAFLREHGIYGAEAETEGFSGYLCELLIYHYGSFTNLLKGFADLKLPLCIIAKDRIALGDSEALRRFNSEFVVVDPTDQNRNVAAAVSSESLARLVLSARRFLSNPKLDTFNGSEYSDTDSRARLAVVSRKMGADLYAVSFRVPDISKDIIWQQLKKLERKLGDSLKKNGLPPVHMVCNTEDGDAVIGFFIGCGRISSVAREGPSALIHSAADAFVKRHGLVYLSGDRMVSIEKPKYENPLALIRDEVLHGSLPSYLKKSTAKIYVNKVPETQAKLIYRKYLQSLLP